MSSDQALSARLPHRGHRVCNDCVQERPKAGANGVVLLAPTPPDADHPLASPGVVIALGGPSGSLRSKGDGFDDFDAYAFTQQTVRLSGMKTSKK